MLKATNIHAAIGSTEVIRGLELEVNKGEVLAVIGANGAGKTSLLRTLSGLLPLRQGAIELEGNSIVGQPSHALSRQGLIHVPQGRQIIPSLSVRENLCLGAQAIGISSSEIEEGLEREFERFPVLRTRQSISGAALSGGEQQMLAVSRGLMMKPKVFMLDEPSLGLAPQVVRIILETLRSLADAGLAVVLVEQVAHLALRYAHRGMVLRNGTCVLHGAAAELRGRQEVIDSYLS